jgi:hypothetical protein
LATGQVIRSVTSKRARSILTPCCTIERPSQRFQVEAMCSGSSWLERSWRRKS